MMSFLTCEPVSKVPTQPRSTQIQGFTPSRNTKSVISCQLPGGGRALALAARSCPFLPLRNRLIRPSANNRLGKKTRNMLKATACDTMPHCGMTRAAVLTSFFAKELRSIQCDYASRDYLPFASGTSLESYAALDATTRLSGNLDRTTESNSNPDICGRLRSESIKSGTVVFEGHEQNGWAGGIKNRGAPERPAPSS